MSGRSFRVFAFDGLRGFSETPGELTGTLTGRSILRIQPEPTARLVLSVQGTGPVPLIVDRPILCRLVISTEVHGQTAPPGGGNAVVRLDADTTVELRELVRLMRDPTSSEAGIYEDVGSGVQLVLPAGSLVEVVEAADGSASWLRPVGPDGVLPPRGEVVGKKKFPWLPVIGGTVVVVIAGCLLLRKKKNKKGAE